MKGEAGLDLSFLRLRFDFRTRRNAVYFPPGKAGNVIRGALGDTLRRLGCAQVCRDSVSCEIEPPCLYKQLFAPGSRDGPSGFAERPRPFVLRARELDDRRVAPDSSFSFDLHLFLNRPELIQGLVVAMAQLAVEGLGPGRGSVALQSVSSIDLADNIAGYLYHGAVFTGKWPQALRVDLSPPSEEVERVTVRFVTPTELKGLSDSRRPSFGVLIARLRDRISALRSFYGDGPLEIDFRGLVERAADVQIRSSDIQPVSVSRRSSHTGQVHSIGGWTGSVEYVGNLREFVPYLEAGRWIGVGRQTVWGNGDLRVEC